MKIWKIESIIETEDNITKKDIISKIYNGVNRGDGIYLDIDEQLKLKLISKVKDEN